MRDPVLDSVNIPAWELPDRTYELPGKTELIEVADFGPASTVAVEWLNAHGRSARLAVAEFGTDRGSGRLWSPNPFLEECVVDLTPNTALDLGCGAGREAVFLASMGWTVSAVDLLPDALERASRFAAHYPELQGRISWETRDLELEFPDLQNLGLVSMLYFLDRSAVQKAKSHLRPGGSLVLETFTERHRERFGKPQSLDRTLRTGELRDIAAGMEIHHLSEDWRVNGRHTGRLWATTPA